VTRKIESVSKPLSELSTVSTGLKVYQTGKGKPKQTDRQKCDRVFHADRRVNSTYGRYLDGIDVSRYHLGWSREWLSYGEWIAEPRRSVPFSGPRLLVRQIPSSPPYLVHAVFTDEACYNDINSMIVFSPKMETSLKFLLGVLNSRAVSFWFQKTFDKLQRKIFPQFKVRELASFPIPAIDLSNPAKRARHDRLVLLVEKMLALTPKLREATSESEKAALQNAVTTTDAEIDRLVYDLYGLTEEEIAIVEQAAVK
jgi:adenine-specific DNA-methyltransferase